MPTKPYLMPAVRAELAKMSVREITAAFEKVTTATKGLTATLSATTPMAHTPFGTVLRHRDTVQHRDTHGLHCLCRIMVIEATGKDSTATLLMGNGGESYSGTPFRFFPAEWEMA